MRNVALRFAFALCIVGIVAACLAADKAIFDGKSLDGWTVTGCKVEVHDGALLLKEGNGLVRTNEKYADFVLSWECKNVQAKDYDSGVYFRFDLPFPKGRAWPSKYQVNLKQGQEGNVQGVKGAESKGLFQPGEWNRFQLTVRGKHAELEINGKPAWKGDGVEVANGYIGLQCETPAGGQFWFRNLRIATLDTK